jgi:peptidyl-prolyl cis-trans isomerase C
MPRFISTLLLLACVPVAQAADRVVASVPGGAAVTEQDLKEEALRLPPKAQAQVLSRPSEVAKFAQNVLVRRELARRAEADGLQNDPKVAAALRVARDRVLSDAALDRAEGTPPDRAALERLARNQYDADPSKFDTPEQVRVRHILVSAKACEAEARARQLLEQARQPGADFAALAQANSDDPGSAARGGDLGFFGRGRMTKDFETAAFALKQPGDLSDVVKTEFGYHVIRLEERKPAVRQPFEEVRDGLVKGLAESESRSRRQQAVDQITAAIKFDTEALESLAGGRSAGVKPQ